MCRICDLFKNARLNSLRETFRNEDIVVLKMFSFWIRFEHKGFWEKLLLNDMNISFERLFLIRGMTFSKVVILYA